MRVHVLFHDRCFDGLASAAMFTRFYKERIDPAATFTYRGLTHKPGTSFTPDVFTDADVHACVDFRYSPSPKLTWWFDHHQSAFEAPGDEAVFQANASGKQFFDPKAKSCTKFLARVAEEKFGFDPKPSAELIAWAETIDGALFEDAKTAVELKAPAMQLMTLAEATQDPELIPRIIRDLSERTLSEVVASDYVQAPLEPILAGHWATFEKIKAKAKLEGPVVTFNKFIAYYLFPEAIYTVAVSRGAKRSKVSVGSSPWRQDQRTHNIAAICESYGGGGHPPVGAISFAPEKLEEARKAAREVVETLSGRG
jgi:hypothetical protein